MNRKHNLMKRIVSLICLTAVLSMALVTSSCGVFKSKEDLLTSKEWYWSYTDYSGLANYYASDASNNVKHCEVLRFYSNGVAELTTYVYYNDKWHKDHTDKTKWELLDENVLLYKGDYYDWKDNWSVTKNKLIIDGQKTIYKKEYTHKNPGIDD